MIKALTQPLEAVAGYDDLKKQLKNKTGVICITGCIDSQKAQLAAGLSDEAPVSFLIAENELKARELYEDCRLYDPDVLYYPRRDLIFGQADLAGNLLTRQRMQVIKALNEQNKEQKKVTIVTPAGGCMDYLLPFRVLRNSCITIDAESTVDTHQLSGRLAELGYERFGTVEASGQFAIRGDIIDIYPLTEDTPVRIELWGDEVDSIRSFDPESQRSIENLDSVTIYPATEDIGKEEKGGKAFYKNLTDTILDYLPEGSCVFLDEPERLMENVRAVFKEYEEAMKHRLVEKQIRPEEAGRMPTPEMFAAEVSHRHTAAFALLQPRMGDYELTGEFSVLARSISSYNGQFAMLVEDLKKWKKKGYRVVVLSPSRTRGARLAADLLDEGLNAFFSENEDRLLQEGEILVTAGKSRRGFEYPMQKFAVITESDIFGAQQKKKKRKKSAYSGNHINSFAELHIGDYVVHENHGLGVYKGIEKIEVDHVTKDFIKLEYAGGSNLYVPATSLDLLQKYAEAEGKHPKINRLGGQEWGRTKSRVRTAVKDIAKDLVALYAARQGEAGFQYGPDTEWQREFEETFAFQETEDQLNAIEETKKDMESPKVMDRLVCGDVGYGKTEIAIRAAFKAVQENKQVVFLCPTTILAQQHYNTFVQRMKDFPVRIDMLSRFRSSAQQKKTLEDTRKGMVDILIGTHRVLSKDVKFKDLGLLIIDEEQRFGVTHKEKIKQMKNSVDVLTLTATPIPRTLHMSLIGIRDMSVLEEPPLDRMPIQTYVMEYDDELVREAISRELARDGQVYFVYNRTNNIADVAARVQELVPDAAIAYAHGKMNAREIEKIMVDFVNGEIDVLISTTIIETGIDVPNANTLIISDADRLGLAQLYQLRGRVGRSNRNAYAFLMYHRDKMLKEVAEKRLAAIREFTDLGSGVKIAMRDLEIRGAGNLLGAEQSGHMASVGYDLYCKLLNEAVSEEKGIRQREDFETAIDLAVNAYIPAKYIAEEIQKLDIYKRIATIETREEADDMIEELIDRYGEPPKPVQNLIRVALIKAVAHRAWVTEIKQTAGGIRVTMFEHAELRNEKIPELLALEDYRLRLTFKPAASPYFSLRLTEQDQKPDKLLDITEKLMNDFEQYFVL